MLYASPCKQTNPAPARSSYAHNAARSPNAHDPARSGHAHMALPGHPTPTALPVRPRSCGPARSSHTPRPCKVRLRPYSPARSSHTRRPARSGHAVLKLPGHPTPMAMRSIHAMALHFMPRPRSCTSCHAHGPARSYHVRGAATSAYTRQGLLHSVLKHSSDHSRSLRHRLLYQLQV